MADMLDLRGLPRYRHNKFLLLCQERVAGLVANPQEALSYDLGVTVALGLTQNHQ